MNHPSNFHDAVADAIKGHHFWEITQGSLKLDEITSFMGDHISRLQGGVQDAQSSATPHSVNGALLGYAQETQDAIFCVQQRIRGLPPLYREAAQRHYKNFRDHCSTIREHINKLLYQHHTPS